MAWSTICGHYDGGKAMLMPSSPVIIDSTLQSLVREQKSHIWPWKKRERNYYEF